MSVKVLRVYAWVTASSSLLAWSSHSAFVGGLISSINKYLNVSLSFYSSRHWIIGLRQCFPFDHDFCFYFLNTQNTFALFCFILIHRQPGTMQCLLSRYCVTCAPPCLFVHSLFQWTLASRRSAAGVICHIAEDPVMASTATRTLHPWSRQRTTWWLLPIFATVLN